jgi:DNA-binding response OmpR family regulator
LEILQCGLLNGDTPPVVVFTSSQRLDEGARAIALGASDFIVKPATWDEYFNAIRDVVERWGRRVQRK